MHYFDHRMIDADVKMNEQTVDYFAFYFGYDTYSEYEEIYFGLVLYEDTYSDSEEIHFGLVLYEDTYSDSEEIHFDLVFGLLKLRQSSVRCPCLS